MLPACLRCNGWSITTLLPKNKLEEYYASYVGDLFRTVRFGASEAHGRAEMMELNYLLERDAIVRDRRGRYAIDYDKMPVAHGRIYQRTARDRGHRRPPRGERLVARYGAMSTN